MSRPNYIGDTAGRMQETTITNNSPTGNYLAQPTTLPKRGRRTFFTGPSRLSSVSNNLSLNGYNRTLGQSVTAYQRYSMARSAYTDMNREVRAKTQYESRFGTESVIILTDSEQQKNLEAAKNTNKGDLPQKYKRNLMLILGIELVTRDATIDMTKEQWVNHLLSFQLEAKDFFLPVTHHIENPVDDFDFVEYAPMVFKRLRVLNGVPEHVYREQLLEQESLVSFDTTSKSKSHFYHTVRGSFIIKSQTEYEAHVLLEMLPSYYRFILGHKDSLLPRFLGLYKVKCRGVSTYFTIVKSVYSQSKRNKQRIHREYDLKGSTVGRRVKSTQTQGVVTRLKDLEFLDEVRDGKISKINFGNHTARFRAQLEADTRFLAKHNVMDYSFLLAIHDTTFIENEIQTQDEPITMQQRLQQLISERGTLDGGFDQFYGGYAQSLAGGDTASQVTGVLSVGRGAGIVPGPRETGEDEYVATFANFIHERDDNGGAVYYFTGIIDILQFYSWKKAGETAVKSIISSRKGISAVPSKEYKKRFCKFILEKAVETGERTLPNSTITLSR